MNFAAELYAKTTPRQVFESLLGRALPAGKQFVTNCFQAAVHNNGDANGSLSIDLALGLYHCFGCGIEGDGITLPVHLGRCRDAAESIAYLRELFRIVDNNGRAVVPAAPWPYFPEAAASLGWEPCTSSDGRTGLRCPTTLADGSPGKTKRRYEKRKGARTAEFEDDAETPGLLNLKAVLDDHDLKSVAIVCGETDLLAWTAACLKEGIPIPAISHSTGETSSLAKYAPRLAGLTTYFFPDNDEPGAKAAKERVEELRPHVGALHVATVPDPHKDVCDFIRAGGTVRELLRLAEAASTPAIRSHWDLADAIAAAEEPPVDEFVARLFPRPSLNLVFGPPSSGKSWAFMALLLDAVCHGGGSFLGADELSIQSTVNDRALWVFGAEDTDARVRRRLRCLWRGNHAEPPPQGLFTYATPPAGVLLNTPEGWKWLENLIVTKSITLLALDTVASLTPGTLDVNKAEQVAPFMGKLLELRARHNLVLFALHHTRKASTELRKALVSHADSMLGAQTWRALADGCLMLDSQDGDTSKVTVRCVKAKDIDEPPPSFSVTLERPSARFRPLEDDETPPERLPAHTSGRPQKLSAQSVLDLRPKFPHGIPWNQPSICSALDLSRRSWFNHRERVSNDLLALGCVVISGSLRWPS